MKSAHQADGVIYRVADLADDARLRSLLRDNPLSSWVSLSLRREPSFFAGQGLFGDGCAVIAHAADAPARSVGMYTCAFLPVHIDGGPKVVGYLGGLRVDSAYRRRFRVVRNGFASIPIVVGNRGDVPFWFTSVSLENGAAVRLLEASLPGMPSYRRVGEIETLTIATTRGVRGPLLRPARKNDIPALAAFYNSSAAAFQFAPALTSQWLSSLDGSHGLALSDFMLFEDGGKLRGCVAVWDQRTFKQTVASAYRFPLNILRTPYNFWAAVSRRAPLPALGRALEHAYLAFASFTTDDTATCAALAEALDIARRRGARAAVIGVSTQNPLGRLLKKRFMPHCYRSLIETVSWSGQVSLDGRPAQPEVALL